MKIQLTKINKLTDYKYINLYKCNYTKDNVNVEYYFTSRRTQDKLALTNKEISVDAVRIVPYYIVDNNIFVVLTKEFRYPINNYVYSTPAGLVDNGENVNDAIRRELQEEIGAKVKKIEALTSPAYTSVGLTDETIVLYSAEIQLGGIQNLQGDEIIEYFVMPLKDILRFSSEQVHDFQAKMALQLFYYKMKEKFIMP